MKTQTDCITFDQLEAARPRPMGNPEHATAFMKERYQIALQIALIDQTGLSEQAVECFPLIENKDYSWANLCAWSLRFETWRQTINPSDRTRFNFTTFQP
jgi:hypothetical protein